LLSKDGLLRLLEESCMKRTVSVLSLLALLLLPVVAGAQEQPQINPEAGKKYNEARALYQEGKYQDALNLLIEATKLQPGFYMAHYLAGMTYKQLRQLDPAIEQYEAAVKFNPNYYLAYFGLGEAYREKNDLNKSIEAYTNAIQACDRTGRSYSKAPFNLGAILMEQGRNDEALVAFGKVIQWEPENSKAYNYMGRIYREKGDWSTALMNFSLAIQKEPNWWEPYFQQANVLNSMGDYVSAIQAADKALERQPGNGGALYEKGIALKNQEKWDEATAVFQQASRDAMWRQNANHQIELITNRDKYVTEKPDTVKTRIPPA
jgi:tetratricopeptide (TPR) repeat protein